MYQLKGRGLQDEGFGWVERTKENPFHRGGESILRGRGVEGWRVCQMMDR
jgi:hypothetical protein